MPPPGQGRSLAAFSGTAPPKGTEDAGSCGTFHYELPQPPRPRRAAALTTAAARFHWPPGARAPQTDRGNGRRAAPRETQDAPPDPPPAARRRPCRTSSGPAQRRPRPRPDWPRQTVRYINLYAPGGANDILSRLFCQAMTQITGQQFVVENRTGAGGTVGSDAIAKSRARWLHGRARRRRQPGHRALALPQPALRPGRDYSFITGLYRQPNILIVNNDVPARSVPEFIALLQANPGRYNYATGGAGTTPHLSAEMFKMMTGTEMPFVQYRGGAPALLDLMAGQVHVVFDNLAGPIGAVRDGKVRALAVTSPERSPVLPDLPALAEFLPGFDLTSWNGMIAPAGLPPAQVQRMAELAHRALARPELVRGYTENGATPWPAGPEDYATYARAQEPLMRQLVRLSGARRGSAAGGSTRGQRG